MKIKNTQKVECAGGIIINQFNKIAIVNQNHDSWSLPKGHIDKGESAINAAVREIYEETGIIHPTLIKKIGTYERYRIGLDGNDDLSELKTIHIFLFQSNQKILTPIDKNNPEARWINIKEVENYLTHKEDIKFFKENIKLFIN
jgi:8-oxo-dGTP pyrophosphatase MutT (NUDIX family)